MIAMIDGGLEFGVNTDGLSIPEIQFYTPPSGGITVLAERGASPVQLYEGVYLWAETDNRVEALLEILPEDGRIIVEPSYCPRWNLEWSGAEFNCLNGRYVDESQYALLLGVMVKRYQDVTGQYSPVASSGGIESWALFNEPDGIGLMAINPGESVYLGLLEYERIASAAATEIRSIDPDAQIISGGFLSPSSDRLGVTGDWPEHAEGCLKAMLGGVTSGPSSPPVPFSWETTFDAFHWHPYDAMEQDSGLFANNELWYDPLVIDSDDRMYEDRVAEMIADDGSQGSLYTWFSSGPDWAQMPFVSLEYCPNYSLQAWRPDNEPTSAEFYTQWRANYFITSNLQLSESPNMTLLAPQMPGGGEAAWWVSDVDVWKPIPYTGGTFSTADSAYAFQSSLLRGESCVLREDLTVNNQYRAAHWVFHDESILGGASIHAFRTYRTNKNFLLFNPDKKFVISFRVDPLVQSVSLFDMTGEQILPDVVPVRNFVSLPATGYVRYAIENTSYSLNPAEAITIDLQIQSPVRGQLNVLVPSGTARMVVYDLSGRIVADESVLSSGSTASTLSVSLDLSTFPAGVYEVCTFDALRQFSASSKVVLLP